MKLANVVVALIGDRALLTQYNALKRRHDGADYADYTAAKADFIAHAMQTST